MTSRQMPLAVVRAVGRCGSHGWAALALLMSLAMTALPGADAPAMPASLPPFQVGVDSLECGLRIDCAQTPVQLVRPEHRLVLSMALPVSGALMRVSRLQLGRCISDHGEYLALLVRPGNREQVFTAESPANRDRQLRLTVDLSPCFSACNAIRAVHGTMTVTMAQGVLRQAVLSARIGASTACDALGSATVLDRSARGWSVRLPTVVSSQLSSLVAVDAGGMELPTRLKSQGAGTEPWTQTEVLCDPALCAGLRLCWYPAVESRDITINLPEIDIPGGIPAIGGLALPSHAPAPARSPVTAMTDALNQAVARGDLAQATTQMFVRAAAAGDDGQVALLLAHHAAPNAHGPDGWTALHAAVAAGAIQVVKRLLAAGCDPQLMLPDGRTCLDVARDFDRWRILSMLLGNPGPE